MRENTALPIKKSFLYCLIVSVAIAAAVGISAILSGEFGSVEIRILLTTLTVSAGSMCGLACWAYLASRRGKILPLAGIVLTFVGSSMILIGIWGEVDSKEFWKVTASASVFAVACAHLALLSLARLAQWFQWSLVVAHVVVFGVASLIVYLILGEVEEGGMYRPQPEALTLHKYSGAKRRRLFGRPALRYPLPGSQKQELVGLSSGTSPCRGGASSQSSSRSFFTSIFSFLKRL